MSILNNGVFMLGLVLIFFIGVVIGSAVFEIFAVRRLNRLNTVMEETNKSLFTVINSLKTSLAQKDATRV